MTNDPNRKKAEVAERAVLVTTSHRGVFFGYATDTDGDTGEGARGPFYRPAELGWRLIHSILASHLREAA